MYQPKYPRYKWKITQGPGKVTYAYSSALVTTILNQMGENETLVIEKLAWGRKDVPDHS